MRCTSLQQEGGAGSETGPGGEREGTARHGARLGRGAAQPEVGQPGWPGCQAWAGPAEPRQARRCCPPHPHAAADDTTLTTRPHPPVGARLRVKACGGNGVHLVHKNDGGGVLLGQAEDVTHHARPLHPWRRRSRREGVGSGEARA